MSLKSELSADRQYADVLLGGHHAPPDERTAAIDILRTVIAPFFRNIHYTYSHRRETSLELTINFNQDSTYDITPSPAWKYSHSDLADKMQLVQTHAYPCSFNRSTLWEEVRKVAREDEWQIDSDPIDYYDNILRLRLDLH